MDEMVLKAMLKWPNVPSCKGWLGLDGRGIWYMRDDAAQAAGPFATPHHCRVGDSPQSRGSRLQHEGLVAFIGRNYTSDERGWWYFQNGPQRVYVELSHAPWVWRIAPDGSGGLTSHAGHSALAQMVFTDECGLVYVLTQLGLGLVHTQDMALCADLIDRGAWRLRETISAEDIPTHFKFVRSPASVED